MTDSGVFPGLDPSDQAADRIIMHVDNDCFYASCERLREPQLRGEPLVIGMGYDADDAKGAVATASYEARAYGVESAQPISEAIERLPPRDDADDEANSAYYRPVDMAYYESVAAEIKAILESAADVVRHVSIDEAYLDCTAVTTWATAEAYATRLKGQIQTEVGVPVSVGVGPTMGVAKVASDLDKPDGLTIVRPEEIGDVVHPLPIEQLHGIGPVTAHELRGAGLETIGDLAGQDPSWLAERLGDRGRELSRRARGADTQPVTPRGDPKSLSRESAVDSRDASVDDIEAVITDLGRSVADRAVRHGATYRTIGIKVVTPPYEVSTRETTLSGPVDDADLVVRTALSLFEEFHDERVRKVGVRVSNLSFAAGDQAQLGTWSTSSRKPTFHPSHRTDGQATLADFIEK